MDLFREQIRRSVKVKEALLDDISVLSVIQSVSNLFVDRLSQGNKILFAGNGGSAADAQHLAAELVSKLEFDRPGLPAMSMATDTSMLTAIGNDYGFERLFARQLQAQSRPGDVFVGITTSGKSKNILNAIDICRELMVNSVVLCGAGGVSGASVDYCIRVPSDHTPRIQECHILIGHLICEEVERQMFPKQAADFDHKKAD
jgi:D-sedoheptulose 7-phosphate isomerase